MCGDPYGFLCDECFGKMREAAPGEEVTFCVACIQAGAAYWEDEICQ